MCPQLSDLCAGRRGLSSPSAPPDGAVSRARGGVDTLFTCRPSQRPRKSEDAGGLHVSASVQDVLSLHSHRQTPKLR